MRAPAPSLRPMTRRADLQGQVHQLVDLLGEHLAERAAEHGEVLGEHEHLAAVDRAPAGDDTVGVGPLLEAGGVGPVAGEQVELVERLPSSRKYSMRSRASSLPFSCWRSTERAEPAWNACSCRCLSSSSLSSIGWSRVERYLLVAERSAIHRSVDPGDGGIGEDGGCLPIPTRRCHRPFDLPLLPPIEPMLAKLARAIPDGDGWLYEPKWDGFRCIVFRDGDDIELGSRNERPFTRYFPELLEPLRASPARPLRRRRRDRRRRRPPATASTSTRCCSGSTRPSRASTGWPPRRPAAFVAFDLLALGDEPCWTSRCRHGARCCESLAHRRTPTGPPARRRPPTDRSPTTGSSGSRAPGSTA